MSEADQSGAGRREVAYRMFAAEFDDADFSYSESDEDRAPNYVITPTGARANRLFVVGVLTEVEAVSEDVLRARVVDPTGAFVLYAGQYQPDEHAFLEGTDPPTFVAVTGKARTFQPDDGDRIFTSIRPESISEVDAETRDRWVIQAAEQTIDRVGWLAQALRSDARGEDLRATLGERGADDGLAHGISLAIDHYGTTPTYLQEMREMALDAARVVAGDLDEVEPPALDPDEEGTVTAGDLVDTEGIEAVSGADAGASSTASAEATTSVGSTGAETGAETESASADATAETDTETATDPAEPTGAVSTESSEESTADQSESATAEQSEPVSEAEPAAAESETAGEDNSEPGDGADAEPAEAVGDVDEELGDFDPDEFELEEETREEIEEEYGTEFQSGTEVEEPGEAGIETPDTPDDGPAEGSAESGAAEEPSTEPTGKVDETEPETTESADETATESADESEPDASEADDEEEDAGEVEAPDDIQATVVDLMGKLDDGDGADREELSAEMSARYGVDEDAVEDAIQDALMDGQCYEPDDDSLKPI